MCVMLQPAAIKEVKGMPGCNTETELFVSLKLVDGPRADI